MMASHRRTGMVARLLLWIAPRKPALKTIGSALGTLKRTGLLRLFQRLWRNRSGSPSILADLPGQKIHSVPALNGPPASRSVLLFRGCLASILDAETITAAEKLLRRLGVTVLIPGAQTCCGGLHREAGDAHNAEALLAQNREALMAEGAEAVITLVSGCGARLAGQLGLPVMDIHEYLSRLTLPETLELAPRHQHVAVQDPCSLRNSLRAEQHVYSLLRRIPGLIVEPLPENQFCCGGAGLYPLREPELASRLREPKVNALGISRPDMLVSANLGCALHLRAGIQANGLNIPVLHPVVLFERQLRERTGLRSVAP